MSANTVEALNTLGKSLLGDNYTPKPGLTDAETINEIAKAAYNAGGIVNYTLELRDGRLVMIEEGDT